MDEPTSSLTRKEVNVLFTIIKSLQAKGLTILFVSHKLDEIIEIAERITVMRDGCIISTFENTDVKEEKLAQLISGQQITYQQKFTEHEEETVLQQIGVAVIVHTILYLPGETELMMQETISYLNTMDIQGIKLQLLHILHGTDLADYYETSPFFVPTMEEYISFLGKCITQLRPDIVIHRLTGDGPKELLIAPCWTGHKRLVLNKMNQYFKEQDLWQGKNYKL